MERRRERRGESITGQTDRQRERDTTGMQKEKGNKKSYKTTRYLTRQMHVVQSTFDIGNILLFIITYQLVNTSLHIIKYIHVYSHNSFHIRIHSV